MTPFRTKLFLAALTLTLAPGCKKDEAPAAAPAAPKAEVPTTPVAAPAPAGPALKEVDLAAWGPKFAGYVAQAPAGTKIQFDDPSRQLLVTDTEYLNINEAPFLEDAIAGLGKDPDNLNIVKVSATEATWERNPPLGKMYAFDTLVQTGTDKWSCNGESSDSAEAAKRLLAICKSIKKK